MGVQEDDFQGFLRRDEAGKFLKEKYGFGSPKTLAKLAVTGGGPEYHKCGAAVLYRPAALDKWALSKIGPAQTSTTQKVA